MMHDAMSIVCSWWHRHRCRSVSSQQASEIEPQVYSSWGSAAGLAALGALSRRPKHIFTPEHASVSAKNPRNSTLRTDIYLPGRQLQRVWGKS